ncbi:hypothetical protein HDV00_004961 [Rhizophlyctis rosea]|nr:hypothetical protein HDV00_004961 [Rhizophlyctis rosea]
MSGRSTPAQYTRAPSDDPDDMVGRDLHGVANGATNKYIDDYAMTTIPLSKGFDSDEAPKKRAGGGGGGANKLMYLEGLRGLAAWWVVNEHFSNLLHFLSSSAMRRGLRFFFMPDAIPVPIFYVLSGRVLVNGFIARREPRMLASAAFRRPFRLGLPLYFGLAMHMLFFYANWYSVADQTNKLIGGGWFTNPHSNGVPYEMRSLVGFLWSVPKLLFYNTLMAHPIGVQWTIPYEFIQSYYVYLLAFVASYQPRRKYLLFGMTTIWSWIMLSWSCAFFSGVIIAELAHDGYLKHLTHMRRAWILRAALLVWISYAMIWNETPDGTPSEKAFLVDKWLEGIWMKGWLPNPDNGSLDSHMGGTRAFWQYKPRGGAVSTAMVLLVEITPFLQNLLANRSFQFLGKISFMMYILHPVLEYSVGSFVLGAVYGRVAGWIAALITYLVTMAVIFGISLVGYNLVDKPSVTAGKWLHDVCFGR